MLSRAMLPYCHTVRDYKLVRLHVRVPRTQCGVFQGVHRGLVSVLLVPLNDPFAWPIGIVVSAQLDARRCFYERRLMLSDGANVGR